jgi:catechol 2,3-dioxygenase-like lactoylglutathione lyase family enzyme
MALGAFVTFIATTDKERARAFYEGTLALRFVQDDDFALVFEHEGVTLRVVPVQELTPQRFTVLGFHVADVSAEARALAAKGVTFERYPGMGQDDLGVWVPAPGAGGVAWFKDPDGNLLSISG